MEDKLVIIIIVTLLTLTLALILFVGHVLIVTPEARDAADAIETVRAILQATPSME